MAAITDIRAEEIRDSRGNPTLQVRVRTDEAEGVFSVPSGASTGSHEAMELRDEDGGMDRAIAGIGSEIAPALMGKDAEDQRGIDEKMLELDGTPRKSKLGGNAILGVSGACARSGAAARGQELHEYLRTLADIPPSRRVPHLFMNYINGGKHAVSGIAFQEHMIVSLSESAAEAIEAVRRFESALQEILRSRYGAGTAESMGDEGGFVLSENDPELPFSLMSEAVRAAGLDGAVAFAIDAAATSFFRNSAYEVGGRTLSSDELLALYEKLAEAYPILSIEDPFEEEDFDAFARLRAARRTKVVGDDLTVTNRSRLARAIERGSIDAMIIKPNQIGTISETIDTMKYARDNGIDCIVSHRSGETSDDFIADLAFAFGAFGLKAGALRRPERASKYERLRTIARA